MNEEIIILFKKFANNQCNSKEYAQVMEIFENGEYQQELEAFLSQDALDLINKDQKLDMTNGEITNLHQRIMFEIIPKGRRPYSIKIRPALFIAASIVICISFTLFIFQHSKITQVEKNASNPNFQSGGDKAILTLSTGKQITLDGSDNGQLAIEGGTDIQKTADGEVVYHEKGSSVIEESVFNTMSTPRGGQYHLTLADGTGVWLNAGSSIKYPTSFTSKERVVEITGEVYFEVAHNAAKPFKVLSQGQIVEVLGTHFNINSYGDEDNIKTTLLEGSVKVEANHTLKILNPGQQSSVSSSSIKVDQVDPEEVIAWKEGYFDFTDADLQTVMRQISRWYDVDVKYVGAVPDETFTGRVSRKRSLNQLLKLMQISKSVHLTFEGRRIVVEK